MEDKNNASPREEVDFRKKEIERITSQLKTGKRLNKDEPDELLYLARDNVIGQVAIETLEDDYSKLLLLSEENSDLKQVKKSVLRFEVLMKAYSKLQNAVERRELVTGGTEDQARSDDDTIGYEIPLPVPSKKKTEYEP